MPELMGKLQATFKSTLHPENLRDLLQRLNCTIAVPCKYYHCCIDLA